MVIAYYFSYLEHIKYDTVFTQGSNKDFGWEGAELEWYEKGPFIAFPVANKCLFFLNFPLNFNIIYYKLANLRF